jgi:hypothetical protein
VAYLLRPLRSNGLVNKSQQRLFPMRSVSHAEVNTSLWQLGDTLSAGTILYQRSG